MELKVLHQQKLGDSITAFAVESPYPRPEIIKYGFDPGTTKLGITVINPVVSIPIMLYQIKMERKDTALGRILETQNVLTRCNLMITMNAEAIIEGASYGAKYRQVELAEVRAAAIMWFHHRGIKVDVIPPLSIRKQVFGSGKVKNPWDNISDDVAASLGCAYYEVSE